MSRVHIYTCWDLYSLTPGDSQIYNSLITICYVLVSPIWDDNFELEASSVRDLRFESPTVYRVDGGSDTVSFVTLVVAERTVWSYSVFVLDTDVRHTFKIKANTLIVSVGKTIRLFAIWNYGEE